MPKRIKEKEVNPYIDKILGIWFKNIIIFIVILIGAFLLVFGVLNGWIGRDFGVELMFFILGIVIGKWLENGKK